MPHVEPGELHALLDGAYGSDSVEGARLRAHLASCQNCRTLLEDERLVRDRANGLLERAAPTAFEKPPFTHVQARANERSRRWGTTQLSWAATIVLALGIGWFGHDLAARRGGEVAPATVDRRPAQQKQEMQPPPAVQPSPSGEQLPREEAARDLAANQRGAGVREQAAVTEERARMAAGANAAAAPAVAPAAEAVAQRAVPQPWVETTLEHAERTLGRRVLLIPGFELIRLELAAGSESVRVFQRIPNDGMIELVQELAEPEARTEAAARRSSLGAADAVAPVSLNVGNVRVSARGPLAPDSLRVLLGRLR